MATSLKSVRATAIASVLVAAGTSSGVKITSLTYANSATAANPAGSETITVTGSGFNSGAKVYIDTLECTTTYVSSTSLTFISPVKTVASYMLYVYNTDGSSGVYPVGLTYSSMPVWVTASDALNPVGINGSYSQTVSATGDGAITYSVTTGSLPSGLNLNTNTGAITGTAPGTAGTSSFTITATDSQNQKTSRSFSIVVSTTPSAVEYLVVAGGGGGSDTGGGGAGGYRSSVTGQSSGGGAVAESMLSVTMGTPYTVTVGGGGTGGMNNSATPGTSGSNSVFGSITSLGGGYGGAGFANTSVSDGATGGSGGGGSTKANYNTQRFGSAGTAGQGYAGGASEPNNWTGGGGGGAGGLGGNATGNNVPDSANTAGNGGVGVTSAITGSAVGYAGGGGGGGGGNISTGLGTSGGGNGEAFNLRSVTAGAVNTGGGGGGIWENAQGASGGSGIVVIRYADSFQAATSTTGSPTITTAGGYRVYKWTSSGSITF